MAILTGSRSSFPDHTDSIKELYNLPAELKIHERRYNELNGKAVLTNQERDEFDSLNELLQDYKLDAEKFNKFGDMVVATQKHYAENTVGYIEQKKTEFQDYLNNFTLRGEWAPSTQYQKFNVVTSGGETYIATIANLNKPTNNALYWQKFASKGEKGAPAPNTNYKGDYSNTKTYEIGDGVTFGTLFYYAKEQTMGNQPTDAAYWVLQNNQVLKSDVEPFDERLDWLDTNRWLYKVFNTNSGLREAINAGAIVNEDGTNNFTPDMARALSDTITGLDDKTIIATKIEAETGTDNVKKMTPLRVLESIKKFVIGGFTATGIIKAQSNTSYTTAQLRNIILSPNDANISQMQDGEVWFKYE